MIALRKTEEKDKKSQKIGKMAQNRVYVPPDRPWFWIFTGQQLYTYALEYSKLIVNQI